MFYELNIFDPWANNPYKRSTEESPGEAFDGMANAWAQITMEVDPATEFSQQQLVDDANSGDMTVTSFSIGEIEDAVKEKMSNLVPNLLPVG